MQLNIYTISHPIIEFLANSIVNTKENEYKEEYYYKYSGFLLMYEILRKHIKIQKIYIKHVYSIKSLYLINSNKKYIILTDLSNTYSMISDIKTILPSIEILHTDYNNHNNYELTDRINNKIKNNSYKNINIFILDTIITSNKITKLVKLLDSKTEISLNNINIACIACYQEILSQLGKVYPTLKVYTAKILYN